MSSLIIGDYKEAEEALGQANLYDPLNSETWGYLTLCNLNLPNGVVKAHQTLKEMFKLEIKNYKVLEEISDKLAELEKYDLAELCYKKIIEAMSNDNMLGAEINIVAIHTKLARIYHLQDKLSEAKFYYMETLKFVEDEERERAYSDDPDRKLQCTTGRFSFR